jgi:hypothetical protein
MQLKLLSGIFMKKHIILFFLIFFILISNAVNAAYSSNQCEAISEKGSLIMKARQDGMSAPEIVSLMNADSMNKGLRNVFMSVIEMAYDRDVVETPKAKQEMITDFKNKVYIICMKS